MRSATKNATTYILDVVMYSIASLYNNEKGQIRSGKRTDKNGSDRTIEQIGHI